MAADGFRWWVSRWRALLGLVDIIRVDHFRGFAGAWAIPAGSETAEHGEWSPAPGMELFTTLESRLGPLQVIAEDLGVITPDVEQLRDAFNFPGMRVLQFAFGGDDTNGHLPHNFDRNSVVYTGTHDNDTTQGWFDSASPQERAALQRYLGRETQDVGWELIRLAMASIADIAIFPAQDVLRLDARSRMNVPGRADGNWRWRLPPQALSEQDAEGLREMTATYSRLTII